MKTITQKIIFTALLSLLSIAALGENCAYKGSTDSKVMGKEEVLDNLVLNVSDTKGNVSFSMKGYKILNFKDISITGTAVLDENGKIVSWDNIEIKGAPAKVKSMTGTLGASDAEIKMTGKAAGVFNFDIHFTAKKQ